jgi:hypothetical protein
MSNLECGGKTSALLLSQLAGAFGKLAEAAARHDKNASKLA